MPLIDRIISLGLLDAAKLAQANARGGFQPPKQAEGPVGADKKAPTKRGSADEEPAPQTSSSSSSSSNNNNDMSSCWSEDEDKDEDECMRARPNKTKRSPIGRAEMCRQKSRRTSRFHEIRYLVTDEDASEGFRLWGFYKGIRVYQMDSPYLKEQQRDTVRTAIGLCYMDLKSVCPPQVITMTESEMTETTESLESLERDSQPESQPESQSSEASEASESPESSTSPESSPENSPQTTHSDTFLTPSIPRPVTAKEVNGCFAIRASALGGLGAFALRNICRGEHILVERPLLRTNFFHLPRVLDRLPPDQRAEYFALHGHHPDPHASEVERIWTANTFVAGRLEAVFVLASRFNHACPPRNNVSYRYDGKHDVLVMTAMRHIDAGTELLISYGKTPAMLFCRFGFRCTCGACAGFSEEMATRFWDRAAW